MIGSRAGAGAFGRAGRVGLLLGLVVILAAHLAGTVHGAAFEGRHLDMIVSGAHHDAHVDRGGHPSPRPEHDHEHEHEHGADGHTDHAADRPRNTSSDSGVLDHGPSELSPVLTVESGSDEAGASVPRDPLGAGATSCGRSVLALHCVRRQ